MNVTAMTDGACSGNPGPGGWAFALSFGQHTLEASGALEHTTNNAAELIGAREAVRDIRKPCALTVITDSTMVVGLLSLGWKRKNAVLRDIFSDIETEAKEKGVVLSLQWTKGHAGNAEQNRVGTLARKEA